MMSGPILTSPYLTFPAEAWKKLRAATPMTLTEEDIEHLRGVNVSLSLEEVATIYLPLSRLLNLYVGASQELYRASDSFLGKLPRKVPFVIGVAGSVAVGKSTTSRVLQQLLARWPNHPKVDLVTTDGFLYPNAVLEERGLMERKGFPESYDRRGIIDFLAQLKAGESEVSAPLYSHLLYDVIPDKKIKICQPDILIVEGLTVLQTSVSDPGVPLFISDFFDFSIYVDAKTEDIKKWYIERFFTLKETVFKDPASYFKRYSSLQDDEATSVASDIWTQINEKNLYENILATRERADLILHKRSDHSVSEVHLRRL